MLFALTVRHEYRNDLSGTHYPCNEVENITFNLKTFNQRERAKERHTDREKEREREREVKLFLTAKCFCFTHVKKHSQADPQKN